MELANSITNNKLWSRHGLKIAWSMSIVLLLLALAFIGYSEHATNQAKAADYSAQVLSPITSNRAPQYRVSDIISANLFGDPRPKEVLTKNIPKTNLNLKLIGVLWASDTEMARVIIQSGGRKADLYSVGDSIKGAGASVKEIHSNEILISRNGATEKLPLIQKKGGNNIISYDVVSYAESPDFGREPVNFDGPSNLGQSSNPKPISPNGENRKIRKPNFSGLDRALQKMGEI